MKMIGPALTHKGNLKNDIEALEAAHSLEGQEGVALTTLRPSGTARFGERRVDVVADGEIVEKDTRIKVVGVRGNQVVVRAMRVG